MDLAGKRAAVMIAREYSSKVELKVRQGNVAYARTEKRIWERANALAERIREESLRLSVPVRRRRCWAVAGPPRGDHRRAWKKKSVGPTRNKKRRQKKREAGRRRGARRI